MKTLRNVILLSLLIAGAVGCSKTTLSEPSITTSETMNDTSRTETSVLKASALVTKIDPATRMITLKNYNNEVNTIHAGPEVRNFAQIKVGDTVQVAYIESIAYEIRPATAEEKAAPQTLALGAGRAKLGAKPAGVVGSEIKVVVKVTKIDTKAGTVTVKNPEGKLVTVKAKYPERLKLVKVGDTAVVTYTEALAISVETAKK